MSELFDPALSSALVADGEVKVTKSTPLDKALPEIAKRVEQINSQLASLQQTVTDVTAMITTERFGDFSGSRLAPWREAYLPRVWDDLNSFLLDTVAVVEMAAQQKMLDEAKRTIAHLQAQVTKAGGKVEVKKPERSISPKTVKLLREGLEKMSPSERALKAIQFEEAGDSDAAAICAETVTDQHLNAARRKVAAQKKAAK